MKHPSKIVILLVAMFTISQLIGLYVINVYDTNFGRNAQTQIQTPDISFVNEAAPNQPEVKDPMDILKVVISVLIALVIAIGIFFLLSKIKLKIGLKIWFTVVVFLTLSVSFSLILYSFIGSAIVTLFTKRFLLADVIAIPLAVIVTFFKTVKRYFVVHNASELFIYPGLAVIFMPLLNLWVVLILLVLISVYDTIAVWKTGHMQKMAKYTIEQVKIFPGLLIPSFSKRDKARLKKAKKSKKKIKVNVMLAGLGGGDIAFSLLFNGVIFLTFGLIAGLIGVACTTLALSLLFVFGNPKKMYPAMPFITLGCLLALGIILILL
ncbi:MAG: presenilin family intramembrane aspartyl protease [archaeon]